VSQLFIVTCDNGASHDIIEYGFRVRKKISAFISKSQRLSNPNLLVLNDGRYLLAAHAVALIY
jgi:hypothetical protein